MIPAYFDELGGSGSGAGGRAAAHPLKKPSMACIAAIDANLAEKFEASNKWLDNISNETGIFSSRSNSPFHATRSNTPNMNNNNNNTEHGDKSVREMTPDVDTVNTNNTTAFTSTKEHSKAFRSLLFYTDDHPQNRRGFRYSYCKTADLTLFPHVQYTSTDVPPYTARASFFDRSPSVALSRDALTVSTLHGFSTARANVFVREGSWYYETKILHANTDQPGGPLDDWQINSINSFNGKTGEEENGDFVSDENMSTNNSRSSTPAIKEHSKAINTTNTTNKYSKPVTAGSVRIGLARGEACLQAPVGFDGYGYGLRDKTGESIHLSRPTPFMHEPFKSGDVIGLHVYLPKISSYLDKQRAKLRGENAVTTNTYKTVSRDRIPIKYKGQMYFESLEYQTTKEMDQLVFEGGKKEKNEKNGDGEKDEHEKNSKEDSKTDENDDENQYIDQDGQELIPGSFIDVYKNGKFMGTAFKNLKSFMPPSSKHGKNKDLPPPPLQPSSSSTSNNVSGGQSTLPLASSSSSSQEPSIPGLATSSTGETLLNGVPITSKQLGDLTNLKTSSTSPLSSSSLSTIPLSSTTQPPQASVSKQPGQIFSPDDGRLGYYPCISVYKGGVAQFNFGPHFDALPLEIEKKMRYSKCSNMNQEVVCDDDNYGSGNGNGNSNSDGKHGTDDNNDESIIRPLCERYHEQIAEDVVYDIVDEVDFEISDAIEKSKK